MLSGWLVYALGFLTVSISRYEQGLNLCWLRAILWELGAAICLAWYEMFSCDVAMKLRSQGGCYKKRNGRTMIIKCRKK